ncbi:unnamed protein product [Adineta ricciae]|uniref:Uncharacterized protein n=1 Tax=Adineta ricciae TaxID=249248 RepID=A0A814HVZ6_ADIRI|nr:unnamed protein product [Adineta ricciae]CAF1016806.1 unnamed protein product [Adineta ricciae]
MNSFFTHFLSLLICSIILIRLTSSASFPDPPPIPPPNASPDDWIRFWKLLHSYYAIIARPRFGKRSELTMIATRPASRLELLFPRSPVSENEIIYTLSGNRYNANPNRRSSTGDIQTLIYSDRE